MDLAIILVILLVVVIVWRGPKTLPLLGRAFGQGVREARREIGELRADTDEAPASQPGEERPPST